MGEKIFDVFGAFSGPVLSLDMMNADEPHQDSQTKESSGLHIKKNCY